MSWENIEKFKSLKLLQVQTICSFLGVFKILIDIEQQITENMRFRLNFHIKLVLFKNIDI